MKYRYVKYNTFSNKFLFYFHIIPIHTRSHASSESVKIARGSDFAELFIDELFIDELLTELINDGKVTDVNVIHISNIETSKVKVSFFDTSGFYLQCYECYR